MIKIYSKEEQAQGAFNGGEIVENKPIGFPHEGGKLRSYSNIFYWANAEAKVDSTIGLHPHQGFEIISFVLEGTIKHFDTKMNAWKNLNAGDVQIIRAGNGISHAEHMTQDSRMFQIWLDPDLSKTLQKEASYSDYKEADFPLIDNGSFHSRTYIGEDCVFELDSPIKAVKKLDINSNASIHIDEDDICSIYVLKGDLHIDTHILQENDFLLIQDEQKITLDGKGQIFYFLTKKSLDYTLYSEKQ